MRIRSITPVNVDTTELERRQRRYDRWLPVGWTLELENAPATPETPDQLDSSDEIRSSERVTVGAGRDTDATRFDALLLDCVLDPGAPELDGVAGVPVLGITRLAAHFLAAVGQKFGVITRNEVIGDEYRAVIARYGLTPHFDDVYVLGLTIDDVANEEVWNKSIERVATIAAKNGTTILINGCSAVEVTVAGGSVRIIDPTALALKVAEFATKLDLVR